MEVHRWITTRRKVPPGAKGSSDRELSKSEVGALVGFSWSADQIEAVDPLVEV